LELTENEKKKEFLMSYQKEKRRVRRLEEQLEELRRNKMSPSVTNDGMPHGTDKKDLSDYAVKVDEIEQELVAARYSRICAFQEVQKRIEAMEDEREKDLLTYRYLKGLKWEEICVRMDYKWRQVHRIHAMAIKNLKMA
jgi:DNA-directed RNA polymerase specialized sigma subunit